ncbi:unnamed protein product [Ranitomeya imitator]|uniref:Stalled ribosome sensor GCN1-like N-terminal domain-containing protein n=1 Tax=Ranitomeya imitator TaxID=111125 RepID=A0ABN9MGS2_9NEOB|nr:unnamed protein product [Ranitomeya imitator]
MKTLWKENPGLVSKYLEALFNLEPNQKYVGMLGLAVQFCAKQNEVAILDKYRSNLLDFYVKMVLMSKVKPQNYILESCTPLLQRLSHEEFKEQVLPMLQKSLLRSPENVIETISTLCASVTLDLSQYALDLGKGLAGQLKSNNPQLMDEAVVALQNLAHQCSDPSAVEALSKHLFAILGGSEGKLTAVAQKMSVLSALTSDVTAGSRSLQTQRDRYPGRCNVTDRCRSRCKVAQCDGNLSPHISYINCGHWHQGLLSTVFCIAFCNAVDKPRCNLKGIGALSRHAVSGVSSQELSGTVSELFIPFLQQEVHEGTLIHAVSVLTQWCQKFTTEVPKKLMEWFQKAASLKTSTSGVRHSYYQCMLVSFKGDTLGQALGLLPLLLQTVEKAAAQSAQIPLLMEALAASVLVCRISVTESQVALAQMEHLLAPSALAVTDPEPLQPASPENKLNNFWQLLSDDKKQIFTSDKFLSSATEELPSSATYEASCSTQLRYTCGGTSASRLCYTCRGTSCSTSSTSTSGVRSEHDSEYESDGSIDLNSQEYQETVETLI